MKKKELNKYEGGDRWSLANTGRGILSSLSSDVLYSLFVPGILLIYSTPVFLTISSHMNKCLGQSTIKVGVIIAILQQRT